MSNTKKRVASALATGAILLQLVTPVAANITIELSGNGADSNNDANVAQQTNTTVVQNNTANISNNVEATANTGNNDANRNTGGDVSIDTGDADTVVGVSNTVNSNEAEVDGCCNVDTDVLISGNGADSDNTVNLAQSSNTGVFQDNYASIKNYVYADSDTGNNDANRNTGGSVEVTTGNADTAVIIVNNANSNWARVGSDGNSGSVSARILGNGAGSDNDINLALARNTAILQYNSLNLSNKVYAGAYSGNNRANRNTGGDVSIDTGNASTFVGIDNMANFNWADLDCGCLLDVMAKIAGNGADSDNTINATLFTNKEVYQDNFWNCGSRRSRGWRRSRPCNDVYADSYTGDNDANRNTGDPGADPSVETGNADTEVLIDNAGNSNSVGVSSSSFPWEWPSGGFEFNLNLSFSLSELLGALGLV